MPSQHRQLLRPFGLRPSVGRAAVLSVALIAVGISGRSQAVAPLGGYGADSRSVTVAGISSGGFMAVQLQVAYSARFQGAAVFAGGPFYCAQGSAYTAAGACGSGSGLALQPLLDYTNQQASAGTIDPTSNLMG